MAKELIGTKDGQNYYVGQDTPAPSPSPAPAPILRYTTPAGPAAATAAPTQAATPSVSTPPTPLLTQDQFNASRDGSVDENAIREATRAKMQAQIDATNNYYADLVSKEQDAGAGRLDKVRALNVNSGLGGSNFATTADLNQRDKNTQSVKAIQDEQAMKIEQINGNIDTMAQAEIAAKRLQAQGDAAAYTTYLDKARTTAGDQLKQLAGAGIDINTLDSNKKAYLFQTAGIDPSVGELIYNSMKPKPQQIDYKFEKLADGQGLFYGTDPTTGELKQIKVNADIPQGFDMTIAPDGTPIIFNKSTGEAQVASNFGQGQFGKADGKNDFGLDPYQQFEATNTIQKTLQSNTAAAQTIQREYTNMKSAFDRVSSGKAADLNAATQAIVTSFNKIIDPNSVVRESEYARSPEGQSLLATLQGKFNAISQGGPGLTKESLKEFVDLANTLNDNAKSYAAEKNAQAKKTAEAFGLNTDLIGGGSEPIDTSDPRVQQLKQNFPDATDDEIRQALGLTNVGADTNSGSVKPTSMMRTDRHNNPTAFTTDIARVAGLKEGVDYTVGDSFSNGKYHTATLLKDPVDTTIKVIDKIGFYTQSGNPRWSYVNDIPQAKNWSNLSYDQKKNVIAQMYAHEGGSQLKQYFA